METMRLDLLVSQTHHISEQQAAALIMAGRVRVNALPADKPGMPVSADAQITVLEKARKYASRSGYKLEKALRVFGVDVTDQTVCDIGASNGGFTDCLLVNGAAHVFAVDVAYGILAWELRNDERVTVMERTNARKLTQEMLGTAVDTVTADVSFISLKKIFPAINDILKQDGRCLCLIKPQFEAPPKLLGKNGVLRDAADLPPLLADLCNAATQYGLYLQDMTVSPIHGTNGNVEYLAHFARTPEQDSEHIENCISRAIAERPDDRE